MHKIEKRPSGYLLTFGGVIDRAEMTTWLEETKTNLVGARGPFGVIVDMRTLAPLAADAQAVMVSGQQLYKKAGMSRSAVIVNNSVTALQFQRLAKESGIYNWERYIDGQKTNAVDLAISWAKDGVDPDRSSGV